MFNKDVKVPHHKAELVGTSFSNRVEYTVAQGFLCTKVAFSNLAMLIAISMLATHTWHAGVDP